MDSDKEDATEAPRNSQWLNVNNLMQKKIQRNCSSEIIGMDVIEAHFEGLLTKELSARKESTSFSLWKKEQHWIQENVPSSLWDLASTPYCQGCASNILAKDSELEGSPLESKERQCGP